MIMILILIMIMIMIIDNNIPKDKDIYSLPIWKIFFNSVTRVVNLSGKSSSTVKSRNFFLCGMRVRKPASISLR